MDFRRKLENIYKKNNSLLCIGLDSDTSKIPSVLRSEKYPQFVFNRELIEATHDLVCAYKPNIAFYEVEGPEGMLQLKFTLKYLKDKYPQIPVILDAKRGDIGSSNKGYARATFDFFCADAITLHPYLGRESLCPFLERKDKGIFILCRTSNAGAGEFQDLKIDGQPLYQIVAQKVVGEWNYNKNCALVVGATYPEDLKIVRQIAGEIPILIPGIGAQGADVEKTVKMGIDKNGQNAIINSSRSIIFASEGNDFAQKARDKTEKLKKLINDCRE